MQIGKRVAYSITRVVFSTRWIASLWPLQPAMRANLVVLGLAWLWWHDRRWLMYGLCFASALREHLRQRWMLTPHPVFTQNTIAKPV